MDQSKRTQQLEDGNYHNPSVDFVDLLKIEPKDLSHEQKKTLIEKYVLYPERLFIEIETNIDPSDFEQQRKIPRLLNTLHDEVLVHLKNVPSRNLTGDQGRISPLSRVLKACPPRINQDTLPNQTDYTKSEVAAFYRTIASAWLEQSWFDEGQQIEDKVRHNRNLNVASNFFFAAWATSDFDSVRIADDIFTEVVIKDEFRQKSYLYGIDTAHEDVEKELGFLDIQARKLGFPVAQNTVKGDSSGRASRESSEYRTNAIKRYRKLERKYRNIARLPGLQLHYSTLSTLYPDRTIYVPKTIGSPEVISYITILSLLAWEEENALFNYMNSFQAAPLSTPRSQAHKIPKTNERQMIKDEDYRKRVLSIVRNLNLNAYIEVAKSNNPEPEGYKNTPENTIVSKSLLLHNYLFPNYPFDDFESIFERESAVKEYLDQLREEGSGLHTQGDIFDVEGGGNTHLKKIGLKSLTVWSSSEYFRDTSLGYVAKFQLDRFPDHPFLFRIDFRGNLTLVDEDGVEFNSLFVRSQKSNISNFILRHVAAICYGSRKNRVEGLLHQPSIKEHEQELPDNDLEEELEVRGNGGDKVKFKQGPHFLRLGSHCGEREEVTPSTIVRFSRPFIEAGIRIPQNPIKEINAFVKRLESEGHSDVKNYYRGKGKNRVWDSILFRLRYMPKYSFPEFTREQARLRRIHNNPNLLIQLRRGKHIKELFDDDPVPVTYTE